MGCGVRGPAEDRRPRARGFVDGFMGRFGALRENPWEEPEIWGQKELPPGRVWHQEGASLCRAPSSLVGDDIGNLRALQGAVRTGFYLNSEGLATPGGEPTFTAKPQRSLGQNSL